MFLVYENIVKIRVRNYTINYNSTHQCRMFCYCTRCDVVSSMSENSCIDDFFSCILRTVTSSSNWVNVHKFSGTNLLYGETDELIKDMRIYSAYFGFNLGLNGLANYPNGKGDEQKRIVKLTNNNLTLRTETRVVFIGVLQHWYLDWKMLPQVKLFPRKRKRRNLNFQKL